MSILVVIFGLSLPLQSHAQNIPPSMQEMMQLGAAIEIMTNDPGYPNISGSTMNALMSMNMKPVQRISCRTKKDLPYSESSKDPYAQLEIEYSDGTSFSMPFEEPKNKRQMSDLMKMNDDARKKFIAYCKNKPKQREQIIVDLRAMNPDVPHSEIIPTQNTKKATSQAGSGFN